MADKKAEVPGAPAKTPAQRLMSKAAGANDVAALRQALQEYAAALAEQEQAQQAADAARAADWALARQQVAEARERDRVAKRGRA